MILVVDYDPSWPVRFDELRREYAGAMAGAGVPVLAIEHVGSPLGELGIPLRWAFKEPERLAGTNTYVVVDGALSLRNHLAIRGILRSDPVRREQYAAVKRRVGAMAANIDEYGQGKSAVISQILAAAGLTEAERAAIAGNQVPSHDEIPR